MKSIRSVAFLVFLTGYLQTAVQAQDVQQYGKRITIKDLKEYLTIIASDAMEGRETGKRGQKMAAAFIQAHFEDVGLAGPVGGNYFQPLDLYTTVHGDTYASVGGNRFNNIADVTYYGSDNSGGEVTMPLIFVGNGNEADFDGLDVTGKAVFMFSENEWVASSDPVIRARQKGAKMIFVSNTQKKEAYDQLAEKIKGVSRRRDLTLEKPDVNEPTRPGLFIVSPLVVDKFFGMETEKLKKAAADEPRKKSIRKIKPATISYKTEIVLKVVKTENVLGYLEGSDKKDEIIVVTAHYDHVGVKTSGEGDLIHNGADDDGSGTVAVLEMAKVFAQAKKEGHGPRRSILFMTVTGEEKGLLGSEYYAEHPVFPLQNTVVDLNIDMIGRSDPSHKNSAPYVYVIGADKLSSELNTVSEAVNKANNNLIFDYLYNDQNHPDRLYYRSDHWNFAKKNIPIIFYFDGIHEDYHKPSDEVDKIEFELYLKRVQTIFYTAWELANRDGRVMPDAK